MCMRPISLLASVLLAVTVDVSGAQQVTPLPPAPAARAVDTAADAVLDPGTAHPLTRTDVNAWLDGYMPYALRTGDIPGAVLIVVKDGQILAARGYGYADVSRRTPVDPDRTLFRPGSVAKLFTWTAVMQLVELGKVDLDKDVNSYLDFEIPPRDGKPVTLRNIMTHTAGFDDTARNVIFNDPARLMSLRDYVGAWTPKRIYAPGLTPSYSNYATALAGYIVQRVSGEPFEDYVEQHIFVPLGMENSTFRQPLPARFQARMSQGYETGSDQPAKFELVGPAPAGALAASGADMGRFMIAHLQNGAFGDNRILRPETAQMMHDTPLTLLPPLNRMELGFFETNINGREVIAHLGDTQIFHTALHLFLEEGVGLYLSVNSLGKEGAASKLRGALFTDFADRYFPGNAKDGRIDARTAAEHARLMSGNWVLSRGTKSSFLNVTELLGQLSVGVSPTGDLSIPALKGLNGQQRAWMEIAPFVWRDTNSHERLAAKVVDGKVVRFSIDGVSPFMVLDRTPWYSNAAWLKPLFFAGLAALSMTALLWPIAALVRRRYGSTLALDKRELGAFRLSRVGAIAILAALVVWAIAIALLTSDVNNVTARFDPVIWFAEVFGSIGLIGGFALMVWHLWVVWTGERRWPAKAWSVVLVLSAFLVLWVGFTF
ncbi:MAG: serine hydrolase domain-containing protein, partial [Steroidobacteraceae bacterium]